MKFCKDCKWIRGNDEFAKCGCPATIKENEFAVTGEVTESAMNYCSVARLFGAVGAFMTNNCGTSARYFEPRAND